MAPRYKVTLTEEERGDLEAITRFDVTRPNLGLLQPALERLGHELRPVVAAKVLRFAAAADHNFFQGVDNPSGWEATSCFEQQAFPGVFVQNGEDAHGASIGRAVLDEAGGF